jgi:uncharacterized membrane protein (DUF4010 family)
MDELSLFYRFGVALFIGILIGLQREYADEAEGRPAGTHFAGVRTFALIALAGCTGALVADLLDSPLIFAALLLLMGGLIGVGYMHTSAAGRVGITTEVAAVITILVGALAYWDQNGLAVAIAVVVLVLLSMKLELHRFAERLTREDVLATVKFAVITAVILPVLPNQSFGPPPFDVLNPYKIWLMVVLISGISFLGYILIKLVGSHRGLALTGLLGGLASSTAVTLSMSARSRSQSGMARAYAMAVLLAWCVMFIRVLVEMAVVNPSLLQATWAPVTAGGLAAALAAGYLFYREAEDEEELTVSNPFELGPAFGFGLLYGLVLLVTRTAQIHFGDAGIYLSSAASGLVDVDAITLSMAELAATGGLEVEVGALAVVLAVVSNTVVKGAVALFGGSASFRRAVVPGFVLVLVVTLGLALLV